MAIGKTNVGGGSGGTMTVTAPANVAVTVSKDGKTKSKNSGTSGVVVFKGLATGTWTLTITDGIQTASKPVMVTADYSTTIAFFSATINVTYPAGSTCTASDGVTTLTAPDTSGTWACAVPNAGTWTVTATDGEKSKSASVEITVDGQSESVTLAYWNGELYTPGNTWDNVTGGWGKLVDRSSVSFQNDAIKFTNGDGHVTVYTNKPIDLTNFSTIIATVSNIQTQYQFTLGVTNIKPTGADSRGIIGASASTGSISNKTLTVDISGLSGSYYILLYAMAASGSVTNVKLS